MAYQVIARKWRPQMFEEVTGQEPITRTLRGAIEHERLHHAYLFSGARGVGKTTTARLLAKALNCHKFECPTITPCKTTDPDQCSSCREIAEGRSIDVLEIDAASNTGVDNVREGIINNVGVRPARDRYKVFIIDEVHMLSGAAFNALLKTLEEPPSRVVFIMATTESHKVPDTILSRCQQFEFRTIATQKIGERLRQIADAEQIKIDDAALREIARAGEGSMRDAQTAFDQVISFSEGAIKTADVEAALGIAGAELRSRVMRAVAEGVPLEALAVVDDLVMRGHDLRNFCRDMMAHVRDLLVIKAAGDAADLVDASEVERKELARAAAEFSESDLVRFFHSLTETEQTLREGAHPRYQLEIGLVKLIEMRRLAPLGRLLERLSALEEALRSGATTAAGGTAVAAPPTGGSAPPSSPAPRQRGGSGGGPTTGGSSRSPSFTPPPAAVNQTTELAAPPASAAPPATVAPPEDHAVVAAAPSLADVAKQPESPVFADAFPDAPFKPASYADAPFWESSQPDLSAPLRLVPPPSPEKVAPPPPPAASSPNARRTALDAPAVSRAVAADPNSLGEQLKRAFEDRFKPLLAIALDGARQVSLDGDDLSIAYAPDKKHLRDSLAKPESLKLLREVCRELLGRDVNVSVVVNDGRAANDSPAEEDEEQRERQRLREIAENHPAVQQLLRTFRAEIIEVRQLETEP